MTVSDGRDYPRDLPRHSVSAAGAVIRSDGRMLAIQRADNREWTLPGGVVELDEDPRDTVRREVLEETGVTVEPGQLTGVYKNMRLGVVSLAFRCRVTGGQAHTGSEAKQVAWLTVDEAKREMVEARAVRVTDALSGSPAMRTHDGTHLLDAGPVRRLEER